MNKHIPAVVLGDGLNALGVVRSLGRRNVPVYVFGKKSNDIVSRSRYTNRIQFVESDDPQKMADQLVEFASKINLKPVLIFTSDYYLRFVSDYRTQLSHSFYLQVPDEDAIETVTDKAKFSIFTSENKLPVPGSYVPVTMEEVEVLAESIKFPVILKPAKSFDWSDRKFLVKYGSKKVMRADNKIELIETWGDIQHSSNNIVIQEMITGDDSYHYSYCIYRNTLQGEVFSICVNKIRVHPIHGGAGSFLRVVNNAEMESIAKKTLEALDYIGVGSVCFKVDMQTNKPLIHEVNGRLPQWHAIFQACGMDLPYVMYRDMIEDPAPISKKINKDGKWISLEMDANAYVEYRKYNEINFLKWLISLYGVIACAEFAWDDRRPFYYFLNQLRERAMSKVKKIYRPR